MTDTPLHLLNFDHVLTEVAKNHVKDYELEKLLKILKPCPFCGEIKGINYKHFDNKICLSCINCSVYQKHFENQMIDEIVYTWNKRSPAIEICGIKTCPSCNPYLGEGDVKMEKEILNNKTFWNIKCTKENCWNMVGNIKLFSDPIPEKLDELVVRWNKRYE